MGGGPGSGGAATAPRRRRSTRGTGLRRAGGALPFLPPLRLRLRARPRVHRLHRLRRHPRAHAGAPPPRRRRQLMDSRWIALPYCSKQVQLHPLDRESTFLRSDTTHIKLKWEDVTDVALEWAKKNVESNPHLSELIEIRNANAVSSASEYETNGREAARDKTSEPVGDQAKSEPPILVGVVKESESFDFCMRNPPFFESIEEAGLNPKTSCGGTTEEMVCPGCELAFITHIIEDSVSLKNSFRWFTSMVGRKANLKLLISKVREAGALVVKTTEFVQGQTARWGLAWSFISPRKRVLRSITPAKTHHSFMLEGLRRGYGAFQVLKSTEAFSLASNLSCKTDSQSFSIDVTLSDEQNEAIMIHDDYSAGSLEDSSAKLQRAVKGASFRIVVFEQIPGTLLIKDTFLPLFSQLEDTLKMEFLSKA